jgi:hypothetical protein
MKKFIISAMLMLTIFVIESKTLGQITLHRVCIEGYEYVVAEKQSVTISPPEVVQPYESTNRISENPLVLDNNMVRSLPKRCGE